MKLRSMGTPPAGNSIHLDNTNTDTGKAKGNASWKRAGSTCTTPAARLFICAPSQDNAHGKSRLRAGVPFIIGTPWPTCTSVSRPGQNGERLCPVSALWARDDKGPRNSIGGDENSTHRPSAPVYSALFCVCFLLINASNYFIGRVDDGPGSRPDIYQEVRHSDVKPQRPSVTSAPGRIARS